MDDMYNEILAEEEAVQLKSTIDTMLHEVKDVDSSDIKEHLVTKLSQELPDMPHTDVITNIEEICVTIENNERLLDDLKKAKSEGMSREAWFVRTVQCAATGMGLQESSRYYHDVYDTLHKCTEDMYRAVTTRNGNINQNPNLNGFIAEQAHVNSYNMHAALAKDPSRAGVVEHIGERFTKSGVDIQIKDPLREGNIVVKRYQAKFCKDAESTAKAIKNGDYKGMGYLVSSDQTEELSAMGIKVHDKIEYADISGDPMTKDQVKQMQKDIQNGDTYRYELEAKTSAMMVGRQAVQHGIMSASIATGAMIAEKLVLGEQVEAEEAVATALESGKDAIIKETVAGAMAIAKEKGIVKALGRMSNNTIANIAFVAVENAKIGKKVASGELTATEGLSEMCDVTCATTAGLIASADGANVGAVLGATVFGVPGAVIGGFVGGVVGYAAGSRVGQAISKGVKTVAKAATTEVKSVGSAIASVGRAIFDGFAGISSIFG